MNNMGKYNPIFFTFAKIIKLLMSKKKNNRSLFKNVFSDIHYKFKFVVTNDATFEEMVTFRLSRMNIFMLFSIITIFSIAFTIFVIWITPLKEYIPGYASVDEVQQVYINRAEIDSLKIRYEQEVAYRDNFYKRILLGMDLDDNDTILPRRNVNVDYDNLPDIRTEGEKKLREKWDKVNDYDLVYANNSGAVKGIGRFVFFTPVHGILVNGFDASKSYYGVDDFLVSLFLGGFLTISSCTMEVHGK